MSHYVVVSDRPWVRYAFEQARLPDSWHFTALSGPAHHANALDVFSPRYVFFVHWSKLVPAEVTERYECINFHLTDLPYGRGGSPLQNLILLGARGTVITAHRMTQEIDAGPVYLKRPLSLEGSAEEVYLRAARLSIEMARDIAKHEYVPVPQFGTPAVFKRRRPEESRLSGDGTLEETYDFVRMLDAEGYPPAFLEHGGLRFEFSHASLRTGRVEARVTIREKP